MIAPSDARTDSLLLGPGTGTSSGTKMASIVARSAPTLPRTPQRQTCSKLPRNNQTDSNRGSWSAFDSRMDVPN